MRKRGVARSRLLVDLNVDLTPEHCAHVLRELAKHLLYMRGQLPALYDVMLSEELAWQDEHLGNETSDEHLGNETSDGGEQQRRPRPKRSRASKQTLNFLLETEALLEEITPQLFQAGRATRAFLLLGASSAKPREAYEFVFNARAHQEDVNVDNLCRLARRELMLHTSSQPEGSAPGRRCKLFVVVEGVSTAAAPPSFVTKRGWRLRMTSGVHMTLEYAGGEQNDVAQQGADDDTPAAAAADATKLWLQSKHTPKGLLKADPS